MAGSLGRYIITIENRTVPDSEIATMNTVTQTVINRNIGNTYYPKMDLFALSANLINFLTVQPYPLLFRCKVHYIQLTLS